MILKLCNGCQNELPYSEFHLDKNKRDGLHTFCKKCRHINAVKRKIEKEKIRPIEDLEDEVWKPMTHIPSGYMISNKGRCKCLARTYKINENLLKPYINTNGYPAYNIRNKGQRIHRLLGIYFIPNPLNLPVINHLDGNKLNYALTNLEWTTILGNTIHKVKMGLHNPAIGERNGSAKLTKEQVKEIYLSYYTLKCLSLKYNISTTVASKIKRGELWQSVTSDL